MLQFKRYSGDFGIIGKGKSLLRLDKVVGKYNDCFIVNNIDKDKYGSQEDGNQSEYTMIKDKLKGKNIAHFCNRLANVLLTEDHYKELGIKDVQFAKAIADTKLVNLGLRIRRMGMTPHFLPNELLEYNSYFDEQYKEKHPNTGMLSIIYATHIIRPKNLWICGMDFYSSDYIYRRPWQSPLTKQREKMSNNDIVGSLIDLIKKFPEVKFNMVTELKDLPKLDNLEVM